MKYGKNMKGRPVDSRLMKFMANPITESEEISFKSKVPMTPQVVGSSNKPLNQMEKISQKKSAKEKKEPIVKVNKDPMSIFQQLRGVDETVKTFQRENPPKEEEKKQTHQTGGTGEMRINLKDEDGIASFSSDDEVDDKFKYKVSKKVELLNFSHK